MKLRSWTPADILPIDRIWRAHHANDFSVPDRTASIVDAVVEGKSGEVVAYGQVRLFPEAMFILDKDASQREKIRALELLMLEAFRGSKSVGLRQLYAFIKDPAFLRLIEKHFHFRPVGDAGDLLIKEL